MFLNSDIWKSFFDIFVAKKNNKKKSSNTNTTILLKSNEIVP